MQKLPNIRSRPIGKLATTSLTNEIAVALNGLSPVSGVGQMDPRFLAMVGIYPVINNSGSDQLRGYSLGISGPSLDPTIATLAQMQNEIGFTGIDPATPTHYAKWGHLIEDVDDGDTGFLYVGGMVCCSKINIVDASHFCAGITNGDPTQLTSTPIGVGRILCTFTKGGATYCYFVFGTTFNVTPLACPP